MEETRQDKIQKTLDFIQKDRIIPEDPWFYSRLIARMEGETVKAHKTGWMGALVPRLRPVLIMMVLLVGITGGIGLGRLISTPVDIQILTNPSLLPEDDIYTATFKEISGSMDEQILLMK